MHQINKSKIFIVLASFLMVFGLSAGQTASARGFGGGHSFGGAHTTRSFHTYHSTPSRSRAYHAPVTRHTTPHKAYRINRGETTTHNNRNSYNDYRYHRAPETRHNSHNNDNNYRRESLGSMFGHSIVRGAGWSIGSNMGNSIWHQTFGFGGDQYYDDNGHVQYARPGFGGWFVMLFFIAIIALIVFLIRRHLNPRDRHHY